MPLEHRPKFRQQEKAGRHYHLGVVPGELQDSDPSLVAFLHVLLLPVDHMKSWMAGYHLDGWMDGWKDGWMDG